MTEKRRIGIIGSGRIAGRFVKEARAVTGLSISGAYNPHPGSARRFSEAQGLTLATESLDELLDASDMIYIASPHGTHADYVEKALLAEKDVLCEKPLCFSRDTAERLYRLAEEKGHTLLEGIKTAYCPGYRKILEVVQSGEIGKPRYIEACFTKLVEPETRELTDPVYGGSFPELGSYVLLPVFSLFGTKYEELSFDSIRAENGADLLTRVTFRFPEALATLTVGLGVKSEGQLIVAGTKGYLLALAPWWKTTKFEIHYEDPTLVKRYEEPFEGDGLRYEMDAFLAGDRSMREISIAEAGVMEQFLH